MSSPRNAVLLLVAAHLAVAQIPGQSALPACGQACVNNMLGDAALACPASDLSCLCTKPQFGFGIRDCVAPACGTNLVAQFTNWATSVCATATLPPAAAAATPSTSSISPAAATTTTPPAPPTTTSIPSTTTTPIVPVVTSTTTVPSTTSISTTLATSTSVSAPPTTSTTRPSSQSSNSASTTVSSAPATSSSAAPEDTADPQTGLTLAAKIGIGVGAGAGAAALLGLLLCILARRRRTSKLPRGGNAGIGSGGLKISHPMPGGGRVNAPNAQDGVFGDSAVGVRRGEKADNIGMTELETNSRRYEEMVPRHQPRTMV